MVKDTLVRAVVRKSLFLRFSSHMSTHVVSEAALLHFKLNFKLPVRETVIPQI